MGEASDQEADNRRSVPADLAPLLTHLNDRTEARPARATQLSRHNDRVYRIDRDGRKPWIARVFPAARSRRQIDDDAAILSFLAEQHYPAERLASDQPVFELPDGRHVVLTEFLDGLPLPNGEAKLAMMGDLLGRLHTLPIAQAGLRAGGAAGIEPRFEGASREDRTAALALLDAVEERVRDEGREVWALLRSRVLAADDGEGLPEALLHGNLLHVPDHALMTQSGPVAINWVAAGVGPRLADIAIVLWGSPWAGDGGVSATLSAYRQHIELTGEELERLEGVMSLRALLLVCIEYARSVARGVVPVGDEGWWGFADPQHLESTAQSVRLAFGAG